MKWPLAALMIATVLALNTTNTRSYAHAQAQDNMPPRLEQLEEMPIGDQVTLTVIYGGDARSHALRQAFGQAPLAAVRKQMRYEAYANGAAEHADWSLWGSKRELPALIVQYNGQEVLVRSGREITDFNRLADELSNCFGDCFRGRRHNPPPDDGPELPPSLPPVQPPLPPLPPVTPGTVASVAIGPTGVAVAFGAFGLGLMAGVLIGFLKRYHQARSA